VGVRGDAADLVSQAGAGIPCLPEVPESIADSVEKLYRMPKTALEMMGRKGHDFYNKELSLSVAVTRFEKVFSAALRNPDRVP
jgi:glycosyltransferase involved in cell wall biosynthesis